MKKIFGILICMLVTISVVLTATGQNVTTKIMVPEINSATVDVSIYDYYFSPTPVTINVGDTVKWTNMGPSPHSSTSDTSIWDSGVLGVGQTYSYTFNTAGTYLYHCSLHTMMHGSVVVTGGNQPPNTPIKPTGPSSLNVSQSGSYSTSATDPNGDQVQYRFDWDATGAHDYSVWSSLVSSGQSVSMSHSWNNAGTYVVEAQAKDSNVAESGWSSGLSVIVTSGGNLPPNTPTIEGSASGKPGVQLQYTAVTTDPDGDNVAYFFDWGDGTNSGWTAIVTSGTTINENHSWIMKGTYTIQVKAKDTNNLESAYATLKVTMPRSLSINSIFQRLIDQHLHAIQILKHLLGL